ncbi:MAG: VTT domain-containing protein [Actinomycetaceae bacterium]|nr:VTT domain-containing protein [Actinomycetaceae bacterium]
MLTLISAVCDSSVVDYLKDPELLINTLLHNFGGWMVAIVALIVFIESGVIFPVLPGDSMVFTLGILHSRIPVAMWITFLCLIVAAILGNVVGYWLGLRYGRGLFKTDARFLSTQNLHKAEDFFEKYGGRSLVLARFVPFVRTFVPIVAGIAKFEFRSFITWNIVGAVAWIGLFLIGGELLGDIPFITHNIEMIAVIIIVVSVLPMVIEYARSRKKSKKNDCSTNTL